MHYYIDGYNLLFRVLKAGDELKKQREQITLDLEAKIGALEIDATLVFDSHYQEDEGARTHFKSLEIIFTAVGETADDFILQELKECRSPADHTVVTSDKKLAHLCRLRLAKTESVDEFLSWMNKRYRNKLRGKKRESQQPIAPPPPAPKPPPQPKESAPAEGCFDYYLNVFEAESKALEEQKPKKAPSAKPPTPQKLKIKTRPQTPEEAHLSDMQRWQRAFENRPD